jgi:hypothetical protein
MHSRSRDGDSSMTATVSHLIPCAARQVIARAKIAATGSESRGASVADQFLGHLPTALGIATPVPSGREDGSIPVSMRGVSGQDAQRSDVMI